MLITLQTMSFSFNMSAMFKINKNSFLSSLNLTSLSSKIPSLIPSSRLGVPVEGIWIINSGFSIISLITTGNKLSPTTDKILMSNIWLTRRLATLINSVTLACVKSLKPIFCKVWTVSKVKITLFNSSLRTVVSPSIFVVLSAVNAAFDKNSIPVYLNAFLTKLLLYVFKISTTSSPAYWLIKPPRFSTSTTFPFSSVSSVKYVFCVEFSISVAKLTTPITGINVVPPTKSPRTVPTSKPHQACFFFFSPFLFFFFINTALKIAQIGHNIIFANQNKIT